MENTCAPASRFSPAKVNLFLAVTGVREDGFHDLVSFVAQCAFGDRLYREDAPAGQTEDSLDVRGADLTVDHDNLILRAAAAFRRSEPKLPPQRFVLEKQTPVGAGLGGGSSNAATTLRLLTDRMPGMSHTWLSGIGARLGSDVPLFLQNQPVVMRGRGDLVEELPDLGAELLRGMPVVLFAPPVAMETARAYGLLRARGQYVSEGWAEERVGEFLAGRVPLQALLFNSFTEVVFDRLPTIAVVLGKIRSLGVPALMSGSGSACFALPREAEDEKKIQKLVEEAWGEGSFFTSTFLL